jgi:ATP-dependent Clp protease ATP-binding subunit ClpA
MNGYNFTERVRRVLALAREEAARLRHEYVGTEHILLALIRDDGGVAITALRSLNVEPESLRDKLLAVIKLGTQEGRARPDLPYTSRAKKVLELAMKQARELNHSYVGTEHLLLGLIDERKGIAAQILVDAGATLEVTAAAIVRLLGSPEHAPDTFMRRPTPAGQMFGSIGGPPIADRTRRVLARAYEIAGERGVTVVSGAHVAIALLAHAEGIANAVLERMRIDVAALASDLQPLVGAQGQPVNPETVLRDEPQLGAWLTSRTSVAPSMSTGDLLLGVLTTTPEVAKVFAAYGVTVEKFRDELRRISG